MVRNSCVVHCNNTGVKGSPFSFHNFPWKKPELMSKWVARVSRKNNDGSNWVPTRNARVCSAHFITRNFYLGTERKTLREDAIPSLFPKYPLHKQIFVETSTRKSPKRTAPSLATAGPPPPKLRKLNYLENVTHDHNYAHNSMESHLEKTKIDLCKSVTKIKSQQQELRGMKKKLARRDHKILNLLDELKGKEILSKENVDVMKENFAPETMTLIENELKSSHSSKHSMRYSDELKSFAVSLHFYSAQAYNYVRKYLHLPHADTIRRWTASHNVMPGFLSNVIESLKVELEKDVLMKDVCLMFDSMSIRKQVVYEPATQSYAGYVNHGHLQVSSPDTLASECLTLLVVGQKRYFKHPIGYFLVDKLSAAQQAQIVRDGIIWLSEAGFDVQSIVCDGAYVNQATATKLGCTINYDVVDPEFPHPLDPTRTIPFLFDACHLLKNVRNALGDLRCLRYGEEKIEWSYIVSLHKLQLDSNLNIANKLKGKHIDYVKNKMKVSLAAQTLSASVASAIDFLRDDMHLPEFAGSEATTKFIYMFDKIFDLCNSSSFFTRGSKSALTKENIESKLQFVTYVREYISSLCDNCGKPILQTKRKTGFLGFLCTLTSIEIISRRLLNSGYKYVLTYRLSQDHLETLFSRIRRRGGWNNNPNVLQFKYALRALLMKNGVLSSNVANCLPTPENTLFTDSINETCSPTEEHLPERPNLHELDAKTLAFSATLLRPSVFNDHVLHYMSGFVCRKLRDKLKCNVCANYLGSTDHLQSDHPSSASLTMRKDRGGLLYSSHDLYTIIVKADHHLRHLLITAKAGPLRAVTPNTTKKVIIKVLEDVGTSVFKHLEQHSMDNHLASEDSHIVQIVKEACTLFCRTMFFHHGKLFTDRHIFNNSGSVRHLHTKQVLFKHV